MHQAPRILHLDQVCGFSDCAVSQIYIIETTCNELQLHYEFNFNFSVTAQPGTAESSDFRATITSVTFQPGETGPKSVNFLTVNDDIVESSELFTVSLSSDVGISLGASASVLIEDNDGKITLHLH